MKKNFRNAMVMLMTAVMFVSLFLAVGCGDVKEGKVTSGTGAPANFEGKVTVVLDDVATEDLDFYYQVNATEFAADATGMDVLDLLQSEKAMCYVAEDSQYGKMLKKLGTFKEDGTANYVIEEKTEGNTMTFISVYTSVEKDVMAGDPQYIESVQVGSKTVKSSNGISTLSVPDGAVILFKAGTYTMAPPSKVTSGTGAPASFDGKVTVVLDDVATEDLDFYYQVNATEFAADATAMNLLDLLQNENAMCYVANDGPFGKYLTKVGTFNADGTENYIIEEKTEGNTMTFISVYTSVEKDVMPGDPQYIESVQVGSKTVKTSNGISTLSVSDGAVILFKAGTYTMTPPSKVTSGTGAPENFEGKVTVVLDDVATEGLDFYYQVNVTEFAADATAMNLLDLLQNEKAMCYVANDGSFGKYLTKVGTFNADGTENYIIEEKTEGNVMTFISVFTSVEKDVMEGDPQYIESVQVGSKTVKTSNGISTLSVPDGAVILFKAGSYTM